MKATRGKLIAWSTVTVGVVVLAATIVVNRHRIAEEWWLYRLSSGNEEAQRGAAKRLVAIKSVQALTVLINKMSNSMREFDEYTDLQANNDGISYSVALAEMMERIEKQRWNALYGYASEIVRSQPRESLPILLVEAENADEKTVVAVLCLLTVLGPAAEPAIPVLEKALEGNDELLVDFALETLKRTVENGNSDSQVEGVE